MNASASTGRPLLRGWATPLTIGSFVLMTATGILMFFDIVPGYIVFAHEWFSWIFVAACAAHIAVNLRPFRNHLRTHRGRVLVILFSAATALSAFSWGRITLPQLKWPIAEALVDAPLAALAQVKRTDPAALLDRLERHGFPASPEDSLTQLAGRHHTDPAHLLGIVFLPGSD